MVVFLCEVEEGASNYGVVRDKPTIEIGKAKEQSYIFDFSWGWPGGDAIKFDWVHGQMTRFYNHSKVFNFGNVELALFKL